MHYYHCFLEVTKDVVKEFAEDGVHYLEIRTTPRANAPNGTALPTPAVTIVC